MATAAPATNSSLTLHEDDVPIVQSLARLQELHNQLNSLRTLLPRRLQAPIIATLHPNGTSKSSSLQSTSQNTTRSRSPDSLFKELSRLAREGVEEVDTFRTTWQSTEMEELWERQKDSSDAYEGGIGSDIWGEDYAAIVRQVKTKNVEEPSKPEMKESTNEAEENVEEIVADANTALKVNIEDGSPDTRSINVRLRGMHFRAAREEGMWTVHDLPSDNQRPHELQEAIIHQLNNREARKGLEGLLDMMASYTDIKTRPCDKCEKVIDSKLRFPFIRKQEAISVEGSEEKQTKWMAYHESCV